MVRSPDSDVETRCNCGFGSPARLALGSEVLDELTVADDKQAFLGRMQDQVNLADYVKSGLPSLY